MVVVLAIVVQFLTHSSWFAIGLIATYFVAKEIAGVVLGAGVGPALLAAQPRVRVGIVGGRV